jgi:hypothetical protein
MQGPSSTNCDQPLNSYTSLKENFPPQSTLHGRKWAYNPTEKWRVKFLILVLGHLPERGNTRQQALSPYIRTSE